MENKKISTLTVKTDNHSYPIIIGENLDWQMLNDYCAKQLLIVSNNTVAPLIVDSIIHALSDKLDDRQIVTCMLPDGEQYKTQDSINQIYDTLLHARFGRDCTVLAVGGGVIGDMAGFAAASFMRGVDFIQVPTTLLAQVDSSVGGKTGINHPLGKNMIGAFWQPKAVFADMALLDSLPPREFAAGMAEVIKYGCIIDDEFLYWLRENSEQIIHKNKTVLGEMVYRACAYKADIVAMDEHEQGVRAYLNFGHTFAHAIETHMGYGNWLHGEAVAVGMVLAGKLSKMLGLIDDDRILLDLLHTFKLPTQAPNIAIDELVALMGHDKKVKNGKLRFVLLQKLGQAQIVSNISNNTLKQLLNKIDCEDCS